MFGLWIRKRPEVFAHWYVELEDYRSSPNEFYNEIEEELKMREVPGIQCERVFLSQGGFATGSREYLRLRRERFVFDICSAPFGKGWFYSCRMAEIPFNLRLIEFAVVGFLSLFILIPLCFVIPFEWLMLVGGAIGTTGIILLALYLGKLHNNGELDVEGLMIELPVVGAIYEVFLSKRFTYYREDSKIMYQTVVGSVAKMKVKEFAEAGGRSEIEFCSNPNPQSPISLMSQIRGALSASRQGD